MGWNLRQGELICTIDKSRNGPIDNPILMEVNKQERARHVCQLWFGSSYRMSSDTVEWTQPEVHGDLTLIPGLRKGFDRRNILAASMMTGYYWLMGPHTDKRPSNPCPSHFRPPCLWSNFESSVALSARCHLKKLMTSPSAVSCLQRVGLFRRRPCSIQTTQCLLRAQSRLASAKLRSRIQRFVPNPSRSGGRSGREPTAAGSVSGGK